MKKQDYRRAVGSIRWTPTQRAEMEQLLRQPVMPKQAPEQKDETRTKEAEYTVQPEAAEQEDYMKIMKRERRQARMYLLILAAALLTIGGTVAAVAWGSRKQGGGQGEQTESTDSKEMPPDLVQAVISPKLTSQQDEPHVRGFAKAETGIFFQRAIDNYRLDKYNRALKRGLCYYDEEAKESVMVCAKPNCLHEGSEFCTATTQNYFVISDPVYLDGYIYCVAEDRQEQLKNPEHCEQYPTVLLRYAPDGTEITPAATLHLSELEYGCYVNMIAHRGQLWISCAYQQNVTAYDSAMKVDSSESRGGYEMFCYEPAAEKLTVLSTSGELQKDYLQFDGTDVDIFKGAGDYVYFLKWRADWRDPVKGSGVFRIDCRTGLIEQVVEIKSQKCQYYAVSGDHIYYLYSDGNYTDADAVICDYDMKTGESKELVSLEKIVQQAVPEFTSEKAREETEWGVSRISVYSQAFFSDSAHLYIGWSLMDHLNKEKAGYIQPAEGITELDLSGNILRCAAPEPVPFSEEYIRARIEKNGYYDEKTETQIRPEELTEADIEREVQKALKNWKEYYSYAYKDASYDGTYFYFNGEASAYRIKPDDLYAGKVPEALYHLSEW